MLGESDHRSPRSPLSTTRNKFITKKRGVVGGGSCAFGGSHGIREEVDGERTLPDRFKRAFRPRRTCSSKLYETSLHASATSLSLPLFSAHVPFRTCACTWTCTYTRIYVYEYENGRCAEATLYLSLFIRQVEPSASLFIQSSCFRAERVSSRS